MTIARSKQICLEQTLWYHCTTRCVRRSFICGFDALTQRDYSHRRTWIEKRLLFLAEVFCIDIGAYAVLSNHYHVVVKIDVKKAGSLSDEEIVERWLRLYSGSELAKRFLEGGPLSEMENALLNTTIRHWRSELANISRFMALINQYIARKANKEDECKGRFWEARFDSQAILDSDALLRTLTYVDLNPVRAKIAPTPESSEHTSVHRRLNHSDCGLIPFRLKPTVQSEIDVSENCLPITFEEYLTLLDWSGRQIRHDKRGVIPSDSPAIFDRLGYSPEQWLKSLQPTVPWRQQALGSGKRIKAYCIALSRRWIWQAPEHLITR